MSTLTKEQLSFLSHHKIHIDSVFDATGMKANNYKALMKELNKNIAFGVSPCKNGHTLRTSSGHCAQCNTANISFMKRHKTKGDVYIAASIALQCVKVGVTSIIGECSEKLNKNNYGDTNDWETLCKSEFEDAGMIKGEIIKLLNDYSVSLPYFHDGHIQETYDLFNCSYKKAFETLIKIKNRFSNKLFPIIEIKHNIVKYNNSNI